MTEIRNRVKELRQVPARELLANPKNWRKHPEKQRRALRAVLDEVGFAGALLAREEEGKLFLIDGHLRTELLPDSIVPVLVLDVTEEEGDKILATLDPIAGMAVADLGMFKNLASGLDLKAGEFSDLLRTIGHIDGSSDREDEAPAAPVIPASRQGDLWLLGPHRLICGDSRDPEVIAHLTGGAKINLVVTSPPYASQRKYDESSGFLPVLPENYAEWFRPVVENIRNVLALNGSYLLNIKEHTEDGQRSLYVMDLAIAHVREWGWRFINQLCWTRKGVPGGWPNRFKNEWEPVFHFSLQHEIKFRKDAVAEPSDHAFTVNNRSKRGRASVFDCNVDNGKQFQKGVALPGNVINANGKTVSDHNAAFPAALPRFFIRAFTDAGDRVFDPFLGSGTTIIAAESLGRICLGVELSPIYCDVIIDRWQRFTGKTAMLGDQTFDQVRASRAEERKESA